MAEETCCSALRSVAVSSRCRRCRSLCDPLSASLHHHHLCLRCRLPLAAALLWEQHAFVLRGFSRHWMLVGKGPTPATPPAPFSQTGRWLSGCEGSPVSRAVRSWTLKQKPNCWLLWPLALKWSLFLWLSSAIYNSMLFTCPINNNTSRAWLWGWQRQVTLTLAEAKFTWHWTGGMKS